jgi:hypothetical protein
VAMAQRRTGENLVVGLQGHDLHIVAMDGVTTPNLVNVPSGAPIVMGLASAMTSSSRLAHPAPIFCRN